MKVINQNKHVITFYFGAQRSSAKLLRVERLPQGPVSEKVKLLFV